MQVKKDLDLLVNVRDDSHSLIFLNELGKLKYCSVLDSENRANKVIKSLTDVFY